MCVCSCVAPTNTVPAVHTVLGQTLDGRDMDMLTLGTGDRKIWLIGRQHPGETMASHFFEGFLDRLMDATDSAAAKLLRDATVFCVPVRMPCSSLTSNNLINTETVCDCHNGCRCAACF